MKIFHRFASTDADKDNIKRFENVKRFARNMVKISENEYNPQALFQLIKIFTDKITNDNALEVIESDWYENKNYSFYYFLFGKEIIDRAEEKEISDILKTEYTAESDVTVDTDKDSVIKIKLSQALVFTEVWNKERFQTIFANHKGDIITQKNIDSRIVYLYLPLGISFIIDGGNHTIYSGKIKGVGEINFNGNAYNKIYDMSKLYDYMYFDGVYYRKRGSEGKIKKSGKIIARAANFEFGCIFEIGRMIYENKISFSYRKWDK